jgi:hypothetical protein
MTFLEDPLKKRHLDLRLYRPHLDEAEGVAPFFLYTLTGQIVGYQQYRPHASKAQKNNPREGRYFTHRTPGTVAVWGVESLHLTPGVVFVTEGIFDATWLTQRGVSALAVLSGDPSPDVRSFLRCLGRRCVAVCDPDTAGRALARVGHTAVVTHGADLGDCDEAFVTALLAHCR